MKAIATGAFGLMVLLFILSLQFGEETIALFVRWDHLNAFAEAAMIGALADWFAVVALFRHPLGIPIWHTAIIPRKKDEIGRNLAKFVEERLLSVDNLSSEISRLSLAETGARWLESEENRRTLSGWVSDGLGTMVRGFDDAEMNSMIGNVLSRRLNDLDGAALLGGGLSMLVESGRHEVLVDSGLRRVADWLPSRRATVREFVDGAVTRTLKWGSKLVPDGMIERTTDKTLEALIAVIMEAAADKRHPLRSDLARQIELWLSRLEEDPDWHAKIAEWKDEAINSPTVRNLIGKIWQESKEKLLLDLESDESATRGYIERGIARFAERLSSDAELRAAIDERLRSVIITFLNRHHGEIGTLVERIIDSWEGEQLAHEMELNLGKDLQYIRLNGTFIGGVVGLVIHLLA